MNAMLKSPKNKGKAFELKVAEEIRRSGVDNMARRRPLSGAEKMVRGHADIISTLPYAIECKKQERMTFWEWWEQAESQATINHPPMLIHSANFRQIMCSMRFTDFLNLYKEMLEWKQLAINTRGLSGSSRDVL